MFYFRYRDDGFEKKIYVFFSITHHYLSTYSTQMLNYNQNNIPRETIHQYGLRKKIFRTIYEQYLHNFYDLFEN